jgi:hypothetical protein
VFGNILVSGRTAVGDVIWHSNRTGGGSGPDGLLGWTRLFSGHVRDPRIGRDILIGSVLGGVLMILDVLRGIGPYLSAGRQAFRAPART